MKKKIPKKSKIDKNQPSIIDYIIANDTNQKVHDVLIQRIDLEERKKEEKNKKENQNNIGKILDEPILRTEKIYIPYNKQISKFCKLSNSVYIDGNIKMRENFFENQKLKLEHWKKNGNKLKVQYLKYEQLDKLLQKNDNYINLGGNCAQQTLVSLINNWQSYWESIKDFSKDKYKYLGEPRIPGRRKKNGEFVLTLTNQQCKIKTAVDVLTGDDINTMKKFNWLIFPDWMKINFKYPNGGLNGIKTRLNESTNLKEVRIVPKGVGYVIEIIYQKVKTNKTNETNLKKDRIIGIDFGKRNIVTIVSNIGIKPIAIKGSTILNLNQFYYKNKGKLQRIYESHKLNPKIGTASKVLDEKHNRRILDIMHKYSRYIINYCLSNKIGTIIIGYNPEWKQEIKLGRKTNQGFVGIPHYTLYNLIMYKAKESNIQIIEQEESHTSKCSFLDNEPIEHKSKGKYLGNRRGGLFISSNGRKINSDVQGAYNIIKKAVLRLDPVNANVILKTYPMRISDRIVGERLHPIRINPLRPEEFGMRKFLTN